VDCLQRGSQRLDLVLTAPGRGWRGAVDLLDRQGDARCRVGSRARLKGRFPAGNVTYLRVNAKREVVAAYDFDPEEEEAESMPIADFVDVLRRWRELVVSARSPAERALPETYRRDPMP